MSIQPALGAGSIGTNAGLAGALADLRRQLSQLQATRTQIADGSITGSQVASGTIDASNIVAGSITAELIAAGAITAGAIAAGSVTTDALAAGSVTADKIAAGSITSDLIQAGAVITGTISAGAITTDKLAAGAVTSDKITATSLSAITTNLGNITAGLITGATIQTAASGSRVVMDSTGIRGYGLTGSTIFSIDAGSGIATLTGVIQADPSSVIPTIGLSGTLGGYNLFSNTSFEVDPGTNSNAGNNFKNPSIGLYSVTSAARDGSISGIPHGSYAYKATGTNADPVVAVLLNENEQVSVEPGATYVFSCYVRTDSSTNTSVQIGPRAFRTDTGALYEMQGISAVNGFFTGALPANSWKRIAFRWTAPSYINKTGWEIVFGDSAGPNGKNFWIDGIQLEKGQFPTAYAPKSDEVLPGIITGAEIAAGTITANNIQAGAIDASVINIRYNGPNLLPNSGFEYGKYDAGVYSTSLQYWSWGPTTTSGTIDTTNVWEGARSAKITSDLILTAPTTLTNSNQPNTGGTLPEGSYTYQLTKLSAHGETTSKTLTTTVTNAYLGAPSGPSINLVAGGHMAPGTYTYYITTKNSRGESTATSVGTTVPGTYPGDPYAPFSSTDPSGSQVGTLPAGNHYFYLVGYDTSGNPSNRGAETWWNTPGGENVRLYWNPSEMDSAFVSWSLYHHLPDGSWNKYGLFVNSAYPGIATYGSYYVHVGNLGITYGINDASTPNGGSALDNRGVAAPATSGSVVVGNNNFTTLSWTAVAGATGYRVYAVAFPTTGGPSSSWHSGIPYSYWDVTSNSFNPEVEGTPDGTSDAPSTNTAKVNATADGKAQLSFSIDSNATGYRIYRTAAPAGVTTGRFADIGTTTPSPFVDSNPTATLTSASPPSTNTATVDGAPYIMSDSVPVIGGEKYVPSGRLKGEGAAIGETIQLGVYYYSTTAPASFISGDLGPWLTLTANWQEITMPAVTVPAGAKYARVFASSDMIPYGGVFYADAMQFEHGNTKSEYGPKTDDYEPGSIGPTAITPNSITTNQILAGGILADRIVAGSITSTQIAANAITSDKIEATAIDGKVITGALIQSAASGQRTQLSSTGVEVKNSSGTTVATMKAPGGALDILVGGTNDWTTAGRQIRWLSGSSALSGTAVGGITSSANNLQIQSFDAVSGSSAGVTLGAALVGTFGGTVGSKGTGFGLTASNTAGQRQITAYADLQSGIRDTSNVLIINDYGESGFIRAHGPSQTSGHVYNKMGIWGPFDSGTASIPAGTSATWTINHNADSNFGPITNYQLLLAPATGPFTVYYWAVITMNQATITAYNMSGSTQSVNMRYSVLYWA